MKILSKQSILLQVKKCGFQQLSRRSVRNYNTMSPEEYLFNQRDSSISNQVQKATLLPLARSNHGEGTTDEIALYGVPYGMAKEDIKDYDTITSSMERNHPDLVFLQIDPCPYIARQRFLSHKCALKGVEDYDLKGIEMIDPTKPISWEETVVNLVVLDMLRENKVHDDLKYYEGLATYAYPYLQDPESAKALTQPFINTINEHIIDKNFSEYNLVNKALFTSLMGKHKVMLGGMPDPLLRQIVGNSVSIEEMRDLFRFVMQKMQEINQPITMKQATEMFLPHIFCAPKDLYMTAMLKESFQAATCITAFVGINHFNPIQRGWEPAPEGVNFTEATRIPDRIRGETDEQLIEKQAMMDVLLESRAWGQKYISNPFPYLNENINNVESKDLESMKKCFILNYKKYNSFKESVVKELPDQKNLGMRLIAQQINQANNIKK